MCALGWDTANGLLQEHQQHRHPGSATLRIWGGVRFLLVPAELEGEAREQNLPRDDVGPGPRPSIWFLCRAAAARSIPLWAKEKRSNFLENGRRLLSTSHKRTSQCQHTHTGPIHFNSLGRPTSTKTGAGQALLVCIVHHMHCRGGVGMRVPTTNGGSGNCTTADEEEPTSEAF